MESWEVVSFKIVELGLNYDTVLTHLIVVVILVRSSWDYVVSVVRVDFE